MTKRIGKNFPTYGVEEIAEESKDAKQFDHWH